MQKMKTNFRWRSVDKIFNTCRPRPILLSTFSFKNFQLFRMKSTISLVEAHYCLWLARRIRAAFSTKQIYKTRTNGYSFRALFCRVSSNFFLLKVSWTACVVFVCSNCLLWWICFLFQQHLVELCSHTKVRDVLITISINNYQLLYCYYVSRHQ